MSNFIRNFDWEVKEGKTYLYMTNRPRFILGLDDIWIDLDVEYADVAEYVNLMPEDVPEELLTKFNEYMDIHDRYWLSGQLPDVVVDTDNPDILDAWTRTDDIKQLEEANGIQYPREMIWVDGAPDVPGVIILPYDDYDKVYTIEDTNTITYLDEYTEGMERPYYIKENGKTYMYVNHFSGGAGTQADPYIVSTPTDLDNVRNNLGAYYKMDQDIDMSGWGNFTPIGNFTGEFDGGGYKLISPTVAIDTYYAGIFAYISGTSVIKHLGVENGDISITNPSRHTAGGIVGMAKENSTIEKCWFTGTVYTGYANAGGIAGLCLNYATIRNCWTNANVTADQTNAGGITSHVYDDSTIEYCYAAGTVTSAVEAGGLFADFMADETETITINDCFYDTTTSGLTSGVGDTGTTYDAGTGFSGKTTSAMQTQSTFTNWDFSNIWTMGSSYPILKAPSLKGSSTLSSNVNVIGLNAFANYDLATDFDKGTYSNTKVVEGKLTLTQGGA